MIEFFPSSVEANVFMALHPDWKPVSVSAGHMSGSVLVLFEAKYYQSIPADAAKVPPRELLTMTGIVHMDTPGDKISIKAPASFHPQPKRRGRPPKVKDAV